MFRLKCSTLNWNLILESCNKMDYTKLASDDLVKLPRNSDYLNNYNNCNNYNNLNDLVTLIVGLRKKSIVLSFFIDYYLSINFYLYIYNNIIIETEQLRVSCIDFSILNRLFFYSTIYWEYNSMELLQMRSIILTDTHRYADPITRQLNYNMNYISDLDRCNFFNFRKLKTLLSSKVLQEKKDSLKFNSKYKTQYAENIISEKVKPYKDTTTWNFLFDIDTSLHLNPILFDTKFLQDNLVEDCEPDFYFLNKLSWFDSYSSYLDNSLFQQRVCGVKRIEENINVKLSMSAQYLAFLYTKFQAFWCFVNMQTMLENNVAYTVLHSLYSSKRLRSFFTKRNRFTRWITVLSFFKDPIFLIKILQKLLYKSRLQNHPVLFAEFADVLNYWFTHVSREFKIKGYSAFFKGKLGKKGSVRKSIFFIKKGLTGLSNNSLRFNHRRFIIITETGVIGCGVSIFFNEMFTFSILYSVIYVFVMLSLFCLFISFNLQDSVLQLSCVRLISCYSKYLKQDYVVSALILTLSGLPPTFVFFLKINFLVDILYNTDLIVVILVIFNLIIGVFFYIHFYKFSNIENELLVFFIFNNNIMLRTESFVQIYYIYLITYLILCLNFSGFFFFDIYIACSFLVE